MSQLSISLGKPLGIPTKIHWTFWILIVWIIYTNASQGQGGAETMWYILFVFAIFTCVILHELGHSLAARRYGIQTRSITILPIGGVASLEKIPENPKQELVVAIAGPLVNIIIAIALWLFLSLTGELNLGVGDVEAMTHINGGNFLITLLIMNILLVVFNMIPAFPMDGGRVLRALLAMNMSRVKATEWAVNIGKGFAILFVFWGLSSNPFLIFIALFIFLSAQAELDHVRSRNYLKNYQVRDVLMKDFTLIDEASPLSHAIRILLNGQEKQFLVSDGKNITGYLTKNDIIEGLTKQNDQIAVEKIAKTNVTWIEMDDSIEEVRMLMMREGLVIMPVGVQGRMDGIVDIDNINEFLLIQRALQNR